MNSTKNRLLRVAVGLLIAGAPQAVAQTLNGAGATFPSPIYRKWFADYRKVASGVKVNYQAIGSGAGIQKVSEGSVDFGATDEPMTDAQLQGAKDKRGDILHFPTVIGAIVPIYNVSGVPTDLNFTPAALAGIYLGKIAKWNDPEIQRANPGVIMPAESITVIHRQDSSGSTFLWTQFLSLTSPEWKAGPGQGMTVKWPVGLSVKGNEGLAHLVKNIWNSIGYVEYSYALQEGLPHGKVQNTAGAYVAANTASITAAAASLSAIPADLRATFINPPGRNAYPIASLTWLLVPSKPTDPAKAKATAELLRWMLSEGQNSVEEMGYARLPPSIVQRELERISLLGQ